MKHPQAEATCLLRPQDHLPCLSAAEGSFDLYSGPPTRVRLRFAPSVVRFVSRRRWHPTQELQANGDGSLDLTMTVAGTVELQSWILSFGKIVEVLEPEALRKAVAEETRQVARMHAERDDRATGSKPSPPNRNQVDG